MEVLPTLRLINALGQTVRQEMFTPEARQHTMSLTGLPKGTYAWKFSQTCGKQFGW
jgi:hypothetical protein